MQRVAHIQLHLSRFSVVLCTIIALSMFLYGALLLMAVSHTASRSAAERQMREVAAGISALETTYFQATKTITPELALERGFVPPASTVTVFATEVSQAVTIQDLQGL